ncbi:DNA polymerase III subunit beta family protein [Kineosporia babensis]|uniref:MerR family transcriptional regulator n=1 Tax=Kineosporia babensis TaxID=499548 RepID=A0A9X1NHF0_9ACTN|nr:MerR family transcriptional regulator [Kineosporia babensis]MCD5313326.1 MerR family transcriptional regulator [Kineosporia babensis]
MPTEEHLPIGAFAQRSGLTTSALRFYADAGLLPPARVDQASGYRYYAESQVERAVLVRRLREIGMPLPAVADVLPGGPAAVKLVEEHVRQVADDADSARRQAALIIAGLSDQGLNNRAAPAHQAGPRVLTLNGPVFAAAVDQILAAAGRDPGIPLLNGIRIESSPGTVILTATDRYRLSTRSLVPVEALGEWAATIDADDLRAVLPAVRRSSRVGVFADDQRIGLQLRDDEPDQFCRLLSGDYPDHRTLLDSLPDVTGRVVVQKQALLAALEAAPGPRVPIRLNPESLTVAEVSVPAEVSGASSSVLFELTTFYPAVSTAIGADLVLEVRGPALPVTIRSADHGDLTTLAMPVAEIADPV